MMFSLGLVEGSKFAEGGKNPLADMDPGGPTPLATDMDRRSIFASRSGGPIRGAINLQRHR